MPKNNHITTLVRASRKDKLLVSCLSASLLAASVVLGGSILAAPDAHAQDSTPSGSTPAPAAPPVSQSNDPIARLMDTARFWDQKSKFPVAEQTWERVLELDPRNQEAVTRLAHLYLETGDRAKAAAYRRKLKDINPNSSDLALLDAEAARSDADKAIITEARNLFVAGKNAEAAAKFREMFKNNQVPTDLAFEYYGAVANSSPEGLKQANDEFKALAAAQPSNARLQLSYANFLRLRESSRNDAIEMLHQLSHIPEVSKAATTMWRETLLWQGVDFQVRDQIKAYLAENPSDAEIEAKRADVEANLPDEALLDRMQAYEDEDAGRMEEAEKGFRKALEHDPNDAEAMIALSTILRVHGKGADADALVAKAMKLAPDRHDEFVTTIGAEPSVLAEATRNGPAGRSVISDADKAAMAKLHAAGAFDQEEAYLRKAVGNRWEAGSYNLLAGIQVAQNHFADAEDSVRQALKAAPNSADTYVLLANILVKEDKMDDAADAIAHASQLYTKAKNTAGLQALHRTQAEMGRERAKNISDPHQRASALNDALAMDPTDPWLRLDLANAEVKLGMKAEAKRLMASAVDVAKPSKEDLYAAMLFAQSQEDFPEQRRLLQLWPAGELPDDLHSVEVHLQVLQQIDEALTLDSADDVVERMVAIANQPDPTGTIGSEVGKALLRINGRSAVRSAISAAYRATPSPTPTQRLAYAGVLLKAEMPGDALAVLAGLTPQDFTADLRTYFIQARTAAVIVQSDQLIADKRAPEAEAVVLDNLRVDPDSLDMQLALVRAYIGEKRMSDADLLISKLLAERPRNADVLLAAIDLSLKRTDYSRVASLSDAGISYYPNDARFYLASAQAAQATGRNGRALQDLRKARELRAAAPQPSGG